MGKHKTSKKQSNAVRPEDSNKQTSPPPSKKQITDASSSGAVDAAISATPCEMPAELVDTQSTQSTKANSGITNKIAIGCSIKSSKYIKKGTVGPLIRIKETGQLCFLTVRNIFGPPEVFFDEKVIGTEVELLPKQSDPKEKSTVCGTVIATEYDEEIDVVLVKILESCKPKLGRFVSSDDEQLRKAGFGAFEVPSYSNDSTVVDARKLTATDMNSYRVVKIGSCTGLTMGTFVINDRNLNMDDYLIIKHYPDKKLTQVLQFKNHLCVKNCGAEQFADREDVGSAVFLVADDNQMHCIGMICRLLNDNTGAVVTPIQYILNRLGEKMKATLQLAMFSETSYEYDDPLDIERFQIALAEGKEHDRQIRINVVGFYGEGKTTLTRRLLDEPIDDVTSTDGIEVHIKKCKIKESGEWKACEKKDNDMNFINRFNQIFQTTPFNESNYTNNSGSQIDSEEVDQNINLKDRPRAEVTEHDNHSENESKPTETVILRTPKTSPKQRESYGKQNKKLSTFARLVLSENHSQSIKEVQNNDLLANIWDFGGQFIYYATHQIFHSRDAIYLLVFDLTKQLDVDVIDCDFPKTEKIENNLRFWVNSIHAFVGTSDGSMPKIILVGTHKDKCDGDDSEITKKFEEIRELFSGSVVGHHIFDKQFAIANLDMKDDSINNLSKTIYDLAVETVREKFVPAKWIPLEMALLNAKHLKILTFQEVVEFDLKNDEPLSKPEDIKLFLKYHHGKGTLVFFDEEILSDYVVVDPQYLIDAFKCIITSKKTCRRCIDLQQKWKSLKKDGIVEKGFIHEIWKQNTHATFYDKKEILLMFLQRHRILAEVHAIDENSGKFAGLDKYLIPSLLQKQCQRSKTNSFMDGKQYTCIVLGISLKNNVVLPTIYERVIAAMVGKWPPIDYENETFLYQNVSFFTLDLEHAGKIEMKPNVGIELMVLNLCPPYTPQPVECDRFRRYVEQVIRSEFRKLNDEERDQLYSFYIRCNDRSHQGNGSSKYHILNKIDQKHELVCCPDLKNCSIDMRKATAEWFLKQDYPTAQVCPDRPLTDKDLSKISQAIGANWPLLGADLGLSSDAIDRIRMQHDRYGIATMVYYMLTEWKNHFPDKHNMRYLIKKIFSNDALGINRDKIRNVYDSF